MNTLTELIVAHPLFAVIAVIMGLLVLGLVFLLGYRFGVAKVNRMMENLVQFQKGRERRRIIRMQAVKPNKRTPHYPYMGCVTYPKKKTLKNITQHRRNRWRN